jgi:hypothetical protein
MKKFNILLIILSILTFTSQAQKVILVPDEEISIPSDNPWGLTYHDDWFWVSDAENGNIIKLHRYLESFSVIKAPRKHITGLTFEGDYLWVLSDEWDTIAFPYLCSQKALLFKLNPENGDVLDTLLIPYYFRTGQKDTLIYKDSLIYSENGIVYYPRRYLMGLSYYDSSLFVSYDGGWGPCLYRVEISNNHITELCCPHPAGLETVKEELWTIRDQPWEVVYPWEIDNADSSYTAGTDPASGIGSKIYPNPYDPFMRNYILPLIIEDSLAKEDWERQLEFDLFASDLAWDGNDFWLLDPWEKKIKRMVEDTIYPDTLIHCFEIQKLEIIPEKPTIADNISVICHSVFTSGGCDMTNYTVEFDGLSDPTGVSDGIHVHAYHEVGMLTYICGSIDTVPIGKLNTGYHLLDYNLTASNLNCGSVAQYIDFFVQDTTNYPVYLEIIPEQPVAGEEVKIVTHGICYLNTWIDIMERHITIYAYWGSCVMSPCGIDTLSLGFLSEESYSLEYYLMDICIPFPADSLVYYDYIEFDVKGATGMEEESEKQFKVYPNPATEQLFIELNGMVQQLDMEIYNMTGQSVMQERFRNTSTIKLDVSGLTSGIYVLKFNADKDHCIARIVIH